MHTYSETIDAFRRKARDERLRVLVWGPGDPGNNAPAEKKKAYQKRLQIKDTLRREFQRAEIFFSEDKEIIALTKTVPGQLRREAIQAKASDLIIMLDIGRGVDLELDHFVKTYTWFRDKVHVFMPSKFLPSASNQGLLAKEILSLIPIEQIDGFSDEEFEQCSVVARSIEVAEAFAMTSIIS